MSGGSSPISWFKYDPDYYSRNDPERPKHLKKLKEMLHIDNLVSMGSSDGSYSLTYKKTNK